MNVTPEIRRNLFLTATIAILLNGGSCGWGPFGCGPEPPDCTDQPVREVVSPSGRHARIVNQTCRLTPEKQSPTFETILYIDDLQRPAPSAFRFLSPRTERFEAFGGSYLPEEPPPSVHAEWMGAQELVVTYSSATIVFCRQTRGILIHCAERDFRGEAQQ